AADEAPELVDGELEPSLADGIACAPAPRDQAAAQIGQRTGLCQPYATFRACSLIVLRKVAETWEAVFPTRLCFLDIFLIFTHMERPPAGELPEAAWNIAGRA